MLIAVFIKARVPTVEVLFVSLILCDSESFAESLIMHELSFAKKSNSIANVGVINHSEDVVIGNSCFLLCCYVIFFFLMIASPGPYPIYLG